MFEDRTWNVEVVVEWLRRSAANVEVPSSNPGAAALGFFGGRYTSTGSPSLEWVLVGNYWLGRLMEPHGVIGSMLIFWSEILGSNPE